jgi:hypothetical protein
MKLALIAFGLLATTGVVYAAYILTRQLQQRTRRQSSCQRRENDRQNFYKIDRVNLFALPEKQLI